MRFFLITSIKAFTLISVLVVLLSQSAFSQVTMKSKIEQAINSSSLAKTSAVSVSVRKVATGQLVYERDGNLLLHTASCLKAFSTAIVLEIMGINSSISTNIYKDNNNLYIKLSGDPLLTSEDLKELIQEIKTKGVSNISGSIVFDDSIIDDLPWGVGWMWDDENNTNMQKISAYNLDQNLVKVKVTPGGSVQVIPDYPVTVIKEPDNDTLKIERRVWLDLETIFVSGKANTVVQKDIPVGSPENYFKARLLDALKTGGISFNGKILKGSIPAGATLLASQNRGILELISFTNQKSNNLAAETLFKIAAAKYFKTTGSTEKALKALKNYYSNWGANPSKLEIVDASGASHNDLLQTNWITLALSALYKRPWFSQYINTLAQPGVRGTLQNRLLSLRGRLWAKSGTNAGISGLSGYIKAKSGNLYAFSILIQNYKGTSTNAKNLENQIVNTVYNY